MATVGVKGLNDDDVCWFDCLFVATAIMFHCMQLVLPEPSSRWRRDVRAADVSIVDADPQACNGNPLLGAAFIVSNLNASGRRQLRQRVTLRPSRFCVTNKRTQ